MGNMTAETNPVLGWAGFAFGGAALLVSLIVFLAGPFAPQQSVGVSLGELAAEIVSSASRSMAGLEQPEPEVAARTIDDFLDIGIAVAATVAILFGIAALVRHESRRLAVSGIALGGFVIAFQVFTFVVAMIAGVILIAAVVGSLSDTFGDLFGG
ncbi:hypothetical protein POI8812_01865 [Pontivivens insulae]|uniref:DUF4064 domain-containing protein n=2 Tax=Pontivivens insulae TaxID=1639689 RepID=A0A2R8ABG1_9RHOB|nr:hypothetical protein DFR53_3308 [Pontivivens insulae]SPF29553.1 hypothetical protein POI8812_01865 [Pontivivens insulae]